MSDPTGTIATPAGYIGTPSRPRLPIAAILTRAAELGAQGFVIVSPSRCRRVDAPSNEVTHSRRRVMNAFRLPRAVCRRALYNGGRIESRA